MQMMTEHLRELVDSFSDLISRHVKLARVEVGQDARAIGVEVRRMLAYLPLLITGYIMLAVAAALLLHRVLPADLAFAIVATLSLGVGGYGVVSAEKRIESRDFMNDSKAEFGESVTALRVEATVGSDNT